jgi:signal peptidase I
MRDQVKAETDNSGNSPSWLARAIIGRNPRRTLVRSGVLALTCFAVFRFVLIPVRVEGVSMWPTYQGRSVNFVNRLSYLWRAPRRGDVVCLRLAAGWHIMYLKRIVGLPGETVEFRRGQLFVNGQAIAEPYVRTPCNWDEAPQQLRADEYYVVGDNRSMASRDHEHGVMARHLIMGKPVL